MRWAAPLVAFFLVAAAIVPAPASSQAEDGLILRVAVQGELQSTNPFYTGIDHWTHLMTRWIYDTPVFLDDEGKIRPYIAVGSANSTGLGTDWSGCEIGNFGYSPKSTWTDSSHPEAVIFYDFTNVMWHDGHQMDIRDILFSYHVAAQLPESRGDMRCLMEGDYSITHGLGIEKLWENGTKAALKFTLQVPYWQFFNRTLAVRLLPEHVWAGAASGQAVDHAKIWCDSGYVPDSYDSWHLSAASEFSNPNPIGSGIFKWANASGDYTNLTAWRAHFFGPGFAYEDFCHDEWGRSLAEQSHVGGIMFRSFRTAESAVLALKSNNTDYIAWSVPPTFIQELANEPGISLYQSFDESFTHLAYNMGRCSFGYDTAGSDAGKPLRRAMAHCIDKNTIVQRLLLCTGIAGEGTISSISPWYNQSIRKYSFDPQEAKNILANAGYKVNSSGTLLSGAEAIAAAGNGKWWMNPDGTPIGSGAGGLIEMLTPEANYDPICAQPGLMIANQFRDVGIYTNSVAMDIRSIEDRMLSGDFDMCMSRTNIDSEPPEFLYSLFHSESVDVGLNHAGYRNSSFDSAVELARSSDNDTVRKAAIFEAQAAVCNDLPYDVLHYKTNIEALRSDRFTGWQSDAGSVFNIQSLRAIRGPNPHKLVAQFVSPPSAVISGSASSLAVLVKDENANPVEGAIVQLSASVGTLSIETGVTSSTGKLTVIFTAPWADPTDPDAQANGTEAIIQIVKAKYTDPSDWEYEDAPSRQILIRVYPAGRPFLSAMMSADPDIISPDISEDGTLGFTYVDVFVTDQDGASVSGASVALAASPAVPMVEPMYQDTDADGRARFTVTATDLPDNDGSVIEYLLTAVAVHPANGTIQGQNRCTLQIVDAAPPEEPPPSQISLSPTEITITVAAIFIAAAVFAYFLRRRRSL